VRLARRPASGQLARNGRLPGEGRLEIFNHVMVLASITLGLGITDLLQTLA